MKTHFVAAAAALALALTAPVAAAPLDSYTSLLVVGDSLSDPGNLPESVADLAAPNPPYARVPADADVPGGAGAKFSNGPVWADLVAGAFPTAFNVAFGGAEALGTGPTDLQSQLGLANAFTGSTASAGANDLGAIWIGANDLFGVIGSSDTDTRTDAQARAEIAATVAAIGIAITEAANALGGFGYEALALFNLPGFENIPLYTLADPGRLPLAEFATDLYNDTIAAIAGDRADTTLVDVNAAAQDIVAAQPGGFAVEGTPFVLTETVVPCFFSVAGPICDDPNDRVFFDAVHPSSATHNVVAATFAEAVAPVPLPAGLPLLLAGLAALALMRRRAGA